MTPAAARRARLGLAANSASSDLDVIPQHIYQRLKHERQLRRWRHLAAIERAPKRKRAVLVQECSVVPTPLPMPPPKQREPGYSEVNHILRVVAAHYDVTPQLIKSKTRKYPTVRIRQIAIYLARTLHPKLSFPSIGKRMGGRDHTTILHAVECITTLIKRDSEIAMNVHVLEERLCDHSQPPVEANRRDVRPAWNKPEGTGTSGNDQGCDPSAASTFESPLIDLPMQASGRGVRAACGDHNG